MNKIITRCFQGVGGHFSNACRFLAKSALTAFALTGAAALCAVSAHGADETVSADTQLSADLTCDTLTVDEGVTLDLNGYNLYVTGLAGKGMIANSARAAANPSYRYYRFKIESTRGDNENCMQISEVKLFDENDGYIPNTSFELLFDSTTKKSNGNTYNGGEPPSAAVDNNVGTKWLDWRSQPSERPYVRDAVWIAFKFAESKTISRYEWWTANDATGRDPTAWRFQGSDDGATWVDLDAQGLYSAPDARTALAYSSPAATVRSEVHVNVAQGETLTIDNDSVLLRGNIKLVKDGAGTLVMARGDVTNNGKNGQGFMGGLDVIAGTLTVPPFGTNNDGSLYAHKNSMGGGLQRVTILPGGTLDLNGAYDFWRGTFVLAGGTAVNTVGNMDFTTWGGNGLSALTADSTLSCNNYWWNDRDCDLGGNTLAIQVATDRYFRLGASPFKNGTVVVTSTGGGVGRFNLSTADNDSRTANLDLDAYAEIKADLHVNDFTFRREGHWGWSEKDKKVFVHGAFKPVSDYFPNVELQNGASLDLRERTTVFNVNGADWFNGTTDDFCYYLTFADNANVMIDVTGRDLALGAKVVEWTTAPSNFAGLGFTFFDSGTNVQASVIMGTGVFFGADPNSTDVVTATWTGAAGDGSVANAGNWSCLNAAGNAVPNAVPSSDSIVRLDGELNIQIPADAALECGQIVFGQDCRLTAASLDWSGLGNYEVADAGGKIDLGGNTLVLAAFPAGIAEITDTLGGGTLRVNVPSGTTATNASTAFTGGFALVKEGAGTFVAAKAGQTYTGGTTVEAGTLKAGKGDADRPFGKGLSLIAVNNGATFDVNGQAFPNGYLFDVRDGGTLALAQSAAAGTASFGDFQFNGTANFIDPENNEIQLTPRQGSARGSAFWKKRVNPALPWRATFHYRTINPEADGFTFILHNDPRGLEALGGTGGMMGVAYQQQVDGTVYQAITPSYGCAYDVWNNRSGWVNNGVIGNYVTTPNDINIKNGIDVVIEYNGTTISQTLTQGGNVATLTRNVDLGAQLGSSAWVGFTGACGGLTVDQRISNFTFEQMGGATFDMSPSDSVWQRNDAQGAGSGYEDYTIGEGDGAVTVPTVRITSGGDQIVSVTYRRPLDPEAPFVLSGTYVRGDNPANNSTPADGGAFIFHSDGLYTTGGGGGNRGVQNGDFKTAYGWAFQTWGDQNLFQVQNAKFGAAVNVGTVAGIRFDSGNPIDFAITYTNNVMTIDLAQTVNGEEKTYTESREVDLMAAIGGGPMYFSMTGGTGAFWIKQLVYNLSYTPLSALNAARLGRVRASGSSTFVLGDGADSGAVARLTLVENATVTVRTDGGPAGELQVGEVLYEAEGASSPSIAFGANVEGRFLVGALTPKVAGNTLVVAASEAGRLGESPAVVSMPRFAGAVPVLDMRAVPVSKRPSAADFVLDSPETKDPKGVRLGTGGVLYAVHNVGLTVRVR